MTTPFAAPESGSAPSPAWLLAAVSVILLATLPPQPEWSGAGGLFAQPGIPFTARGWFDLLQNVALYVPLGLAVGARSHRAAWRAAVVRAGLLGASLSLATELLQFVVPGRDPSANDLIANTLGALAGAALLTRPARGPIRRALMAAERRFRQLAAPSRRTAGLLSLAWAAVVAALLAVTAQLLLPAPPEPPYLVASPSFDLRPGPLRIGSNGAPDGFFSGTIDEVRLYARALSAEEIRADMGRPVAAANRADGAIAAYGFDERRGTQARDATGRGHDGTVVHAEWTAAGRFGAALAFDGRSSMVVVPASAALDLTDALTIEAWVFPTENPGPEPAIVAHAGRSYFLASSSEDRPMLPAAGGTFAGVYESVHPPRPLAPGRWTHLAFTYDGRTIRLYVNGGLAASDGRWSPHRAARVSLDGLHLPPGRVAGAVGIERSLRAHTAFHATIVCGAVEPASAAVFLVTGQGESEVFALRAHGNDLSLGTATWPRRLGLAAPDVRLPRALQSCSSRRSIRLAIDGPLQNPRATIDGQRVRSESAGVASSWALLFHSDLLPSAMRTACTVVWLVLLLFPFGFWARRSSTSAAGALILLLAFTLVPGLWNVAPLAGGEIVACMVGAILGSFARRLRT